MAVFLVKRVQLFDRSITPVACCAGGHGKIYKTDLETMDVHFRRLLRSIVGSPSQTNWLNAWHEILYARVEKYIQEASPLAWSQRGLPDARWV